MKIVKKSFIINVIFNNLHIFQWGFSKEGSPFVFWRLSFGTHPIDTRFEGRSTSLCFIYLPLPTYVFLPLESLQFQGKSATVSFRVFKRIWLQSHLNHNKLVYKILQNHNLTELTVPTILPQLMINRRKNPIGWNNEKMISQQQMIFISYRNLCFEATFLIKLIYFLFLSLVLLILLCFCKIQKCQLGFVPRNSSYKLSDVLQRSSKSHHQNEEDCMSNHSYNNLKHP